MSLITISAIVGYASLYLVAGILAARIRFFHTGKTNHLLPIFGWPVLMIRHILVSSVTWTCRKIIAFIELPTPRDRIVERSLIDFKEIEKELEEKGFEEPQKNGTDKCSCLECKSIRLYYSYPKVTAPKALDSYPKVPKYTRSDSYSRYYNEM